jgi:hypothetical protein
MKNLRLIVLALLVLLTFLVLYHIYLIIDEREVGVLSKSQEYREEIETPAKKVLNGHLGVLFRFKYLGNINWLAVPLVLWFLLTGSRKKRERWQLALAFVWLTTMLFIGLKGYYNSRYQLTLFPFTTALVILLMWELVKEKRQAVRIVCFSLLILLCAYNVSHYFDQFKYFWQLKVSRTMPHFPEKIVDYLSSRKEIGHGRSRVFVLNQPLYYYHIRKHGIDYMSPYHIGIFFGLKAKTGDRDRTYNFIRKRKKVKYMFMAWTMVGQYKDRLLGEFLNCECKLLISEYGYRLYEIRDPSLNRELQKSKYTCIKSIRLFQIRQQGTRGVFHLDKNRKKRILTVSNRTPGKEGQRLIQMGFDSGTAGSILTVPAGRYIHFLVDAKLPEHLVNRENFIFIQDFKGTWERDKIHFATHHWRTYLISRKIREGSERFTLGIKFVPQSQNDKLMIRSIRAFVSDEPL